MDHKRKNVRPDKKKVVDEVWDEARIASFLDKQPMGTEAAEFSILLNAYRGMRLEDFARFIAAYKARGLRVDARSNDGRTLAETIAGHRKAAPFAALLQ